MSSASSASVELNADVAGVGAPVLILHGLLGSSRNWRSISRSLAQTYQVHTLDMRNHGASPWSDTMDYPAMAADLVRYLDDRDLQQAAVIGHSMGGKAAMALALLHPDRLERLVVVDIAPRAYDARFGDLLAAMLAIDLDHVTRRSDVQQTLLEEVGDAGLAAFLAHNLMREGKRFRWAPNLDVLEQSLENLVGFIETSGRVYAGPTVFLDGAESDYIIAADRVLISELFPRARVQTIADAGHWLHAEQAAAVTASLRQFLAGPA